MVLEKPSTLNSVILAQLFRVFPLTVILTYLPVVPPGKRYVSGERVVPLLLPVNTFVKVVPSFETDITKLFCRVFPLYHAISTLQMFIFDPKSAWIHEPIPGFDHLVLRLLSKTLAGRFPSLPLDVAVAMGKI